MSDTSMVLKLDNITKEYASASQPVVALKQVSITVSTGEMVAIEGPSGSGKSTLLMIAAALLAPTSGSVHLKGQDLLAMSSAHQATARARHIGFVFQQFHLIPYLTATDNVLAAAIAQQGAQAKQQATELLTRFGLADRCDHLPSTLSVGEQQRTALARALLNNPALILADEPTGNLDPDNAAIVMGALRDFADSGGAVLLATHQKEAAQSTDRRLRLKAGVLDNISPATG